MDKLLGAVSLAKKAGRLQIGEEAVASAARDKKARLILLAADAAENTAFKAEFLAEKANCPLARPAVTREELGEAIGRGVCALAAITDMGLAAMAAEGLAAADPGFAPEAQAMRAKADRMDRRKKQTAERRKKRG